jgi:hypothetical protein
MKDHPAAPTGAPLSSAHIPDEYQTAQAIRAVLSGKCSVEHAFGVLSTSEMFAVSLACGRDDLLPKPYRSFRDTWRRLDERQRHLVDVAARAAWFERD